MFQERLDEFLRKQDTLENVFFWVTLGLVGLASFMSAVSSVVEKLPGSTVTFCFFCFLCVVLLGVLAKTRTFCIVLFCEKNIFFVLL